MTAPLQSFRLFVVEDHPVMRQMVCEAIERRAEWVLSGAAVSAEEAMGALTVMPVDLVLVDVSLPRMNGIELVRALRERRPELRCLMLSGHAEGSYAAQALSAGALGYILKGRPEDLEAGIRATLQGEQFLSEPLRHKLETRRREGRTHGPVPRDAPV
jgi:DNA-binding NarL/FixJ family response regulator